MKTLTLMNFLAYIGPGSGLVISASLVSVLVVVLTVVFGPIFYPMLMLWHVVRGKRVRYSSRFRKVVLLGLDGLDHKLTQEMMEQGKLPNFSTLAKEGSFNELATVWPALTPAAWPSFMTGNDPSYHGIFDFITRDPHTYGPKLSSSEVVPPKKTLKIGSYVIPISSGRVRTLRKGIPFWKALARAGLQVTVLRVPITFPPERFAGRLLSGMCVPDLRGTQGTYTIYSTIEEQIDPSQTDAHRLNFSNGSAKTQINGPAHPFREDAKPLSLPMMIERHGEIIQVRIADQKFQLKQGEQSGWISIRFRAWPASICGQVQFYLQSVEPNVRLYMSPIHLDPERAAMSVSHPRMFADYLAKRGGAYGTLGLMEDTSAMNDGVLDEDGFLKQAWSMFEERKRMFLQTLEQKIDDVTVCVFDTSDRIQHMFWRYRDESHPAPKNGKHGDAIERMMIEMDQLIGQTRERLGNETLLLVMSDHGFTSFRRGVNLNTWLHRQGFLHLKDGARSSDRNWLEAVDWKRTRAYAIGLTGLYLNLKGRESSGIVETGDEAAQLLSELKQGLEMLGDDGGIRPIRRVWTSRQDYTGPFRQDSPDLLIGYEAGYRCSWECAKGQVTDEIFSDNTRAWSGDHIVDPALVPGVLFANAPVMSKTASIIDIAPTILEVFSVKPEAAMRGRSVFKSSEGDN